MKCTTQRPKVDLESTTCFPCFPVKLLAERNLMCLKWKTAAFCCEYFKNNKAKLRQKKTSNSISVGIPANKQSLANLLECFLIVSPLLEFGYFEFTKICEDRKTFYLQKGFWESGISRKYSQQCHFPSRKLQIIWT